MGKIIVLSTILAASFSCPNPEPKPTPSPTPIVNPTPVPPTPTPVPPTTVPPIKQGPYLDGKHLVDKDGNPCNKCTLVPVEPPPTSRLGPKVNQVITTITGCPVGSDCPVYERPQEFMAKVINGIRNLGLGSGQHEPGITDEIAGSLPSVYANWEGFHIYSGKGWDDPSSFGKVVWFYVGKAGSYRGAWRVEGLPPEGNK